MKERGLKEKGEGRRKGKVEMEMKGERRGEEGKRGMDREEVEVENEGGRMGRRKRRRERKKRSWRSWRRRKRRWRRG